ncbi:MAG: TIGR02757 family protein [Bacteroidales bacterium]|nr:TIGR02757 family protein [Bacteroidales bacterium]
MKDKIIELANKYNTVDFIKNDPVQFPHRYTQKLDIEVSAFVTQWVAFGNRKQIVKCAETLDSLFNGTPYNYIMGGAWKQYENSEARLYRFYTWGDFHDICARLNSLYTQYKDMEQCIDIDSDDYSISLRKFFDGVKGIPASATKSAAKRVNMMLRWLVRDDGIVDFGIWKTLDKRNLLIPLDTHVHQQGRAMGITTRNSADITTAKEITDYMKTIFPDDPTLGDFALFGLGVDEDGK